MRVFSAIVLLVVQLVCTDVFAQVKDSIRMAEERLQWCQENELNAMDYVFRYKGIHIIDVPSAAPVQFAFSGFVAKKFGLIRVDKDIQGFGSNRDRSLSTVVGKGRFDIVSGESEAVSPINREQESRVNSQYEINPFRVWLSDPSSIRDGDASYRSERPTPITKIIYAQETDRDFLWVTPVNVKTRSYRILKYGDKSKNTFSSVEFAILTQDWTEDGGVEFPLAKLIPVAICRVKWNKFGSVQLPTRFELERYPKYDPEFMEIDLEWGDAKLVDQDLFSKKAMVNRYNDASLPAMFESVAKRKRG
jgi:hypothetical protein